MCTQLCPTLCSPMDYQGLLCLWNFPDKNTGAGCHYLLQGIFWMQGSNPVSSALAGGFFTTGATWEVSPFKMHTLMLPVLSNPQGLWIQMGTRASLVIPTVASSEDPIYGLTSPLCHPWKRKQKITAFVSFICRVIMYRLRSSPG